MLVLERRCTHLLAQGVAPWRPGEGVFSKKNTRRWRFIPHSAHERINFSSHYLCIALHRLGVLSSASSALCIAAISPSNDPGASEL